MKEFEPIDNSVIVKIYDADMQERHRSEAGVITTNLHKPLMDMCQIGEVMKVGKQYRSDYQVGDIILFTHAIQDDDFRLLGKDDEGEFRIVKEGFVTSEIYGVIKNNKKGGSRIVPRENYCVAIPKPHHTFDLTHSLFQVEISYLNPADTAARKLGLKVGDWIVCQPYSAYSIVVKRQEFWFIFLEDILAINKGCHKLAIERKHVSQLIRLGSRKNVEELN